MTDKKDRKDEHPQGGYMRSLHKLEEKLYGPEMKLNGSEFKVLLYIRHNSIRWDKEDNEFSYGEISKAIGVDERQLKRIIRGLVNEGLLLIAKVELNNRSLKNYIGLNPKYFGDLVEETCRPKFSVIQGGKAKKLSTGVVNLPPSVVVNLPPQGGVIYHPGHIGDPLLEPDCQTLKNPSKEQIKKLLGGSLNFLGQESGDRDPEEHKQKVLAQLERMKRGESL